MSENEGPGGAGAGDPDGVAGAENREVAGVMGALKASADHFRKIEAAAAMETVKTMNRQMAVKCEAAIAELEGSLDREPVAKPKPPPSPSALFRAGWDYGAAAAVHAGLPEEKRPEAAPPPTWEDAWAVVRAKIAEGR